MGVKDTIAKQYMQNSLVFADLFNYMIYSGRQVIQPDNLYPLDSTAVTVPYHTAGTESPVQRERDVFRYLASMTDDRAAYLLLGIENQSAVHYAMPVRSMVYDALAYAMQVEETARSHRKQKDSRGHNAAEYLSGFYKEDRLLPVITAVVYLSPKPWDGPVCLHDMLMIREPEMLPFIENYRIHLLTPEGISEAELERFHSTLHEVLGFIKYSGDKEKLKAFVTKTPSFLELEPEAASMIRCYTDLEINIEEKEGVNMCKAINDMMEDAREQGIEQGIESGIKQGIERGKMEAAKALLDILKPEVIAQKVGLPIEVILQIRG